jgi:hypothetical protein
MVPILTVELLIDRLGWVQDSEKHDYRLDIQPQARPKLKNYKSPDPLFCKTSSYHYTLELGDLSNNSLEIRQLSQSTGIRIRPLIHMPRSMTGKA